jgi:hypothetical protein
MQQVKNMIVARIISIARLVFLETNWSPSLTSTASTKGYDDHKQLQPHYPKTLAGADNTCRCACGLERSRALRAPCNSKPDPMPSVLEIDDRSHSAESRDLASAHHSVVGANRTTEEKGTDYLFSGVTGNPLDMNVYRQRKLKPLLVSLKIKQAGFHAFRHFNVAMLGALRVPLKTIQERIVHAVTGSFALDVYGGQPEWERNLEAARLLGLELEKAVNEAEKKQQNEANAALDDGLTPIQQKGSGVCISQAL